MQSTEEKKGIQKDLIIDRKSNLHSHKLYWIGRRAQDIFFSAVALIVLSPVMLITALAIMIDDPGGSPIFAQDRVGRNGKLFKFYKFRSMCVDAEAKLEELLSKNEMDGPVFKIKDDPRITRVGKFIRKTSIDELPQLWNILKGDMSIVGPRPALPREVEQYGDYERQRLYVQPGLSCYWQIAPHRNELSFEEWMELDVKYVQERSFFVDWKIIFMTANCKCKLDTRMNKNVRRKPDMFSPQQTRLALSRMPQAQRSCLSLTGSGGIAIQGVHPVEE